MPNLSSFKSKEERNDWYRAYRKTHARKLRKYWREYRRRRRAARPVHN